jgi:hypothetical protein
VNYTVSLAIVVDELMPAAHDVTIIVKKSMLTRPRCRWLEHSISAQRRV